MNDKTRQLFDVDNQFCLDSQTNKSQAWAHYFSDEVLMGSPKHHSYYAGKDLCTSLISKLYLLENLSFSWEPQFAFISDDETLGVTTGIYTRKYLVNHNEIVETGKYVTTWKKINNMWKIVLDLGN